MASKGKEPASLPAVGASDNNNKKNAATESNPRGIPKAPFVDRVEDYVSSRADVEATLKQFQEMISKYQFMEMNLKRRVSGLKDKLPDIQKTLDTVRFLKARSAAAAAAASSSSSDGEEEDDDGEPSQNTPIETTFELNDTLYARAEIPAKTEEVFIWLGANVMLSYPLDEAEELLAGKLKSAQTSLGNCNEDLDFLREQVTTMEVALARVYNWDVMQKRKEKSEGEEGEESETKSDRPPGG